MIPWHSHVPIKELPDVRFVLFRVSTNLVSLFVTFQFSLRLTSLLLQAGFHYRSLFSFTLRLTSLLLQGVPFFCPPSLPVFDRLIVCPAVSLSLRTVRSVF